jgi:hypothetical protein
MAILTQIGGISTGGLIGSLEGPLSSLFKNNTGSDSYQYPKNLGNDPSRMHIVQFRIKNLVPRKFISSETPKVEYYNSNGEAVSGEEFAAGSGGGKLTRFSGAATTAETIQNAVETVTATLSKQYTQSKATINLYMPDTLNMNYNHSYDELSLGAATKGFSRILQGGAAIAESISEALDGTGTIAEKGLKAFKGSTPQLTEAAGTLIDRGLGTDITGLLLSTQARAINPQLQLLYKGIGLRTFSMEFLFTPKSKEEADEVSAIINAFVYASTPEVTDVGGMYFIPPSVFEVEFLMAKTGKFSGFSDMLQKAGNGIIPGLGGALAEKIGLDGSKGSTNDRLFKVGDCVLDNVSVDYAPNGWAAHDNGAPVQTRMTLQFKELDIINRGRMRDGVVR